MPSPKYRYVRKGQFFTLMGTFLLSSMLLGVLLAGLAIPAAGGAGIIAKAGPRVFETLPTEFDILPPSEVSVIKDVNGKNIAQFYAENRIIVSLDDMSPFLRDAIVSIEDRRFYEHKGIDPEGMGRAAINNLAGRSTQGASTLTQQFIKNTILESGIQKGDQDIIDSAVEQTVPRKLREARFALALEQKMSKEDILAGYLNIAPFGPNVYGAEAASLKYFSKHAKDLDLPQAALLAGIVKSPTEYDPLTAPEEAQNRRDTVLQTMLAEERITQEEYDQALEVPIADSLSPSNATQGCAGAGSAAYFCDYVREELLSSEAFGKDRTERQQKLLRGGLTINTTLDWDKQNKAVAAIQNHIPINDPSGVNAVVVSRDPNNGHILAMAQNTNYGLPTEDTPNDTQNSYAADTAHGGGNGFPAGSTLKPFTLLEWFREGHTAWERVANHSTQFYPEEWNTCAPEYNTRVWDVTDVGGKRGTYNALQATELSVNRAFAHMGTKLELCSIFDGMKAMGITKPDGEAIDPIPANIISAEATPLAMAGAYGAFAQPGKVCAPMAVTEVLDRDGNPLATFEPQCSNAVDTEAASKVTAVLRRSASSGNYYSSHIGRPIIAKTGTSDDSANAWLVGGTPQMVTAVWTGYAKNSSKSMNHQEINGIYRSYVYGGTLAAPLWQEYMQQAVESMEVQEFQEGDLGAPPPPPRQVDRPKKENKSKKTNNGG
ncbi:MAG: transglycosylase domain-containing protein [Actinomycetaceae bacterium]|nr:transglycosylase domain-containing protein [Actinomycetaceae bacterium]